MGDFSDELRGISKRLQSLEDRVGRLEPGQRNQTTATLASELPAPNSASDRLREVVYARIAIINFLEDLAKSIGDLGKALKEVVTLARLHTLPPHIQELVPVACAGSTGEDKLSQYNLFHWREVWLRGGAIELAKDYLLALPLWAELFLTCYLARKDVSVGRARAMLRFMKPDEMRMPSKAQCERLLKQLNMNSGTAAGSA